MSFSRSKMILDFPNCFGRVQIVLVGSKSFWLGPNHFGQVQIRLFWTNLDLSKICPSIVPKWFWTVQIVLDGCKLFWLNPNCFGLVQIILVMLKLDLSWLIFIIWTWPKRIGPVQNNWYSTKMNWTVQNYFGPIEGQGIKHLKNE